MSAEHLRTWPSAARRLRAAATRHSLPRKAATWAPSLSWLTCHPCHPPREVLHSPSSQNISQATRGGLPVIIGCPNINVTLTQWPPSLPSPLVNLMDLLTPVPPRTATDFAACQPLEGRVLKTVGRKKGETRLSAYLAELSSVSRALASALRIVCALQGPVTGLALPPPPLKAVAAALTAAPALSLLQNMFRLLQTL